MLQETQTKCWQSSVRCKIRSLKVEFASKRTSVMTKTTSKESVSVPAPVQLRRKKRGHRAEVVMLYKFMVTTIEEVAK